ncbi:diheme cytochrome c [Desulfosediminicola ganghwensis]|uniref:diheme cytochrome c n=1 Tax=Desulfosediminicola ganghwensis TaxID=2569540 RepID=UPI001E420B31|nr:diheme cytochrome c [Desulfosediminicola ganghwensis]
MNTKFNLMQLLANPFIIAAFCLSPAYADDKQKEKYERESFSAITNETYKQECGACHFNYQPGLLASASWEKLINTLPFHFDEDVSIDEKSVNEIEKYLIENSAENSTSKRARKILHSLKGQVPLRISETPYIKEKHHELNLSVFDRPSIGSRSNCIACHTTAEQGDYDDDNVKIPK